MDKYKSFVKAMPVLMEWLDEKASTPIKYRLLIEMKGINRDDPKAIELKKELYKYQPAIKIIKNQKPDGSWGSTFRGTILGSTMKEEGPYSGLEYQFSRLLEMGFDSTDEAVQKTAKLLMLYLGEKRRVPLFEAGAYLPDNPEAVEWYLRLIRIISAKLLSFAGYQNDEILRKWLITYTNSLNEYLEGERSKNPYSKYNNRYIVDEEIMMPGHHILDLYAYNKWLREGLLGKVFMPKLGKYLSNFPPPPDDCPYNKYSSIGWEFPDLYIKVGNHLHRGLGVPSPVSLDEVETKYKNRIPAVVKHLEMRARSGLLMEDDPVLKWFLSHQDDDGRIIIPGKIDKMIGRGTYHYYPLNDDFSEEGKSIDLTFRALLIVNFMRKIARVKLSTFFSRIVF